MPSPADILDNLRRISNEGSAYAVGWHVLLGSMIVPLLYRRMPSARLAAWVVVALLGSVSAFAWRFGNLFNGCVFALLALCCAWLSLRAPGGGARSRPAWARALGVLMFSFGWVYPHFVEPRTALSYLYEAPTGLIPCPTLSVALAFALLGWLRAGRAWTAVLVSAGLFYGLFGVLRLGVALDVLLLAGTLGLLFAPSRVRAAGGSAPSAA